MKTLGLFFDGKFGGELFCVECYSEDDKNWGIVILQIDGVHQPVIVQKRTTAQETLEGVENLMKEMNEVRQVRISRYLRG